MSVVRPLSLDDVPEFVELYRVNREFLRPWEPDRRDEFFTADGQRSAVADALERHAHGSAHPHAIVDESGRIVGRITVENVVRRAFQSCTLGYWVSQDANGHGLASTAVHEMVALAFGDLGLHRVEAATLTHNGRSQRVLEKNGFLRFGHAPAYLRIAGRWQDHDLFHVLNPSWSPPDH